jgi:hypothetical protein
MALAKAQFKLVERTALLTPDARPIIVCNYDDTPGFSGGRPGR